MALESRGDQVQGGEEVEVEESAAGLVSPPAGLRKIRRGSGGRVSSGSAVSDSPSARQIDRVR